MILLICLTTLPMTSSWSSILIVNREILGFFVFPTWSSSTLIFLRKKRSAIRYRTPGLFSEMTVMVCIFFINLFLKTDSVPTPIFLILFVKVLFKSYFGNRCSGRDHGKHVVFGLHRNI